MDIKLYYKNKEFLIKNTDVDFYNWTEGNFSCDCNRGIKINEELECNKFENKIKIKIYESNKLIYNEI